MRTAHWIMIKLLSVARMEDKSRNVPDIVYVTWNGQEQGYKVHKPRVGCLANTYRRA
jgi:hypothetical protein